MTSADKELLAIYGRLQATGLPCLIVGSVASSAYGEPRSTLDIDVVVKADGKDAERILSAFPGDRFYVPPIEVLRRELSRSNGTFNIIDSETSLKADIYPAGSDPLIAYAFDHAQSCVLGGQMVRLAPPTYLVAMKLRYFAMSHQDKHLRDIRGILAVSADRVDKAMVERVAIESGVAEAWSDCQRRAGDE
jgi:hypothetical protein